MPIECGSQIIFCDNPIRLDTYKGCSHGCTYCFARRKTEIQDIKPDNCLKSLKNFINGKRNELTNWCDWDIPLHWGGMSDPFQPCEKIHRISYKALEIFAETYYPFVVSTKGKIIADDEYIELLSKCNVVVQISMVSPKYDQFEKGAQTWQQRLEICRKVSPHCKRLIVRVQPYTPAVLYDVISCIPKLKEAGVYGITIEGLKGVKKFDGSVKVNNDFCYPLDLLKFHYEMIKKECVLNGIHFFCSENRLRFMGESPCCCGCDGLNGFKMNICNYSHYFTGDNQAFSNCMKQVGTANVFKSNFQEAGYTKFLKNKSFSQIMESKKIFDIACKTFNYDYKNLKYKKS